MREILSICEFSLTHPMQGSESWRYSPYFDATNNHSSQSQHLGWMHWLTISEGVRSRWMRLKLVQPNRSFHSSDPLCGILQLPSWHEKAKNTRRHFSITLMSSNMLLPRNRQWNCDCKFKDYSRLLIQARSTNTHTPLICNYSWLSQPW